MTRVAEYAAALRELVDWEPFLLANSGLPGPRGNLELAQAVADLGSEAQFRRWIALGPDQAPVNSPEEFLVFCGVRGMGSLLVRQPDRPDDEPGAAQGSSRDEAPLAVLRRFAADPRWRSREAVAMALQRWGDADMQALLAAMDDWSGGTPWEQRAAAAALCEPRLLTNPPHAEATLHILDVITASLRQRQERKTEAFRVLRQGLGYCWSVAVSACPEEGKPLMEKWCIDDDRDVRWIMRENLRKNRLGKMDATWTAQWLLVV